MESIRTLQKTGNSSAKHECPSNQIKDAEPLTEAGPGKFMRSIKAAGKYVEMFASAVASSFRAPSMKTAGVAAAAVLSACIVSGCVSSPAPFMGEEPDASTDIDTDADTDSDVDTDADTDSDTDTDTETSTDTESDTDTDTETSTDTESDTDSDTDTDTDTESDTDTDTDSDTDTSTDPPDTLTMSILPDDLFTVSVKTSDTSVCTFMAEEIFKIQASSGEFIVDGYPFGTFYSDEHTGDAIYFIGAGDGYATTCPCSMFSGLDASEGVSLLAQGTTFYAYEAVEYPEGYFEAKYEFSGGVRYIGRYNSSQYTTPNGLDTVWMVSDMDSLSIKESLGLSIFREGADTLKAASNPPEDNGAFIRFNADTEFAGGEVYEAAPSGLTVGSFDDSTVVPPTSPGNETPSGVIVTQTGANRVFTVPASD
jgi:hypothetical protein